MKDYPVKLNPALPRVPTVELTQDVTPRSNTGNFNTTTNLKADCLLCSTGTLFQLKLGQSVRARESMLYLSMGSIEYRN